MKVLGWVVGFVVLMGLLAAVPTWLIMLFLGNLSIALHNPGLALGFWAVLPLGLVIAGWCGSSASGSK